MGMQNLQVFEYEKADICLNRYALLGEDDDFGARLATYR